MDYCFLNFFTLHRSYTVFLTKSVWLWASELWKELVGVMWQLELLVSEKIIKQLWFQLVLLKDSQNTRKPMSDIGLLEKSLFRNSQGSAVTYFRWSGQIYNLMVRFIRFPYMHQKLLKSFDRVFLKTKRWQFFGTQCRLHIAFKNWSILSFIYITTKLTWHKNWVHKFVTYCFLLMLSRLSRSSLNLFSTHNRPTANQT